MQITVNGTPFDVQQEHLSYEDLVLLAGMPERGDLTVTYSASEGDHHRSGTLTPSKSIDVEDNMVFDAVYAGNA